MSFASDTFTDTDGTALNSHTPDTGSSWAGDASSLEIQSNQARAGVVNNALYMALNGTTPASNEYDVESDISYDASSSWTSNNVAGVAGRASTGWGGDGYIARVFNGTWNIFRNVSGSLTSLGSYVQADPGSGVATTAKLEIRSATKKLYLNGVERISSADDTVTQVGLSAITIRGRSSGDWRHDNFVATAAAGGGGISVPTAWHHFRNLHAA